VNIYGSAAKGNKPGGFNDLPADASAADITRFQSSGFELFDEETAWNYELGAKGRVGRVNFGVAGFYVDWSRQQLTRSETYTRTNGQLASSPFIQNAGKSEIKGFEFELSGKPSDWLFLRLGYSYTDAKFKRFYDETTEEILDRDGRPSFLPNGQPNPANTDGFGGDVAGNRLPQVPAHQIVASAEVTQPVGEGLNAFVRGDFGYDSKRYVQVDNLAWVGDSYNLNLSAGIEHPRWSFAVWVENALQDKTPLVATRLVDFNRTLLTPNRLTGLNSLTFYRDFTLSAPRKRQVGATATFRF
jgi:outer membrane receptor protein involved in Fe transport